MSDHGSDPSHTGRVLNAADARVGGSNTGRSPGQSAGHEAEHFVGNSAADGGGNGFGNGAHHGASQMSSSGPRSVTSSAFFAARKVWRVLPRSVRYAAFRTVGPSVRGVYDRFTLARPVMETPVGRDAPFVLAGLFSTANGIGEAARVTYRALCAAGVTPIAVDLSPQLAPVDMQCDIPLSAMPDAQEGTLLLQLNAPEIPTALHHLDMRRGRRWRTIGYWAWELPIFPKHWDKAFAYLSDVWAISTFTKSALALHPRAPDMAVFGHAVCPPDGLTSDRGEFGLPSDAFVFLAMADSMSSMERKDPFSAIAAHREAFGDDPRRVLVLKTRNLARDPLAQARLEGAIAGAGNIRVMDVSLSERKRWELMHAVDAVVSLHRAEGYGLVMAEAMAIGKPVVCTGWSGNMDFTTQEAAFLVDYTLIPCDDPYDVYRARGAQWAQADVAHAAQQLRRVAEDGEARECVAAAGRAARAYHDDLARVGAAMARTLGVGADDAR